MKNQKKAMLFGLITVLLWSTVACAFKITLSHFEPIQMVLIASLTSIVLLIGIAFQQQKLHLLKQYFVKQPLLYLTLGVINPFLYYLVLFKAYDLLPASQAQSLNYTWAITLTLLSVPFLGQKIRKKDWVAILFSYSGALIIATKGDLLRLHFESPLSLFFLCGLKKCAGLSIHKTKLTFTPLNFEFKIRILRRNISDKYVAE